MVAVTPVPWVLVAGSFHRQGGMDKANATLAAHLLSQGREVHLVTHFAEPELVAHPLSTVHLVGRPAGSYFLGEYGLEAAGRRVAARITRDRPDAVVVVNGGNCRWPGVNWVHSVHAAWECRDAGAPVWFRIKNRLFKRMARMRERRALTIARTIITNSEQTRHQVIDRVGVSPDRVRTVYLGTEPDWGVPSPAERADARRWLGIPEGAPLVVFIGALGHDDNKGFDVLVEAWSRLAAGADWDGRLIAAGGGSKLDAWRRRVATAELSGSIRLIGRTDRVRELLAAADLLVSPSHYDAYGLAVQEAICRGVPALVSVRAGIAERYPPELAQLVLPDPGDAASLADRLLVWRREMESWRIRFLPLADRLRSWSWADASKAFVAAAEGSPVFPPAGAFGGAAVRREARG